jgi:DNA polymerase III delta prime subunit
VDDKSERQNATPNGKSSEATPPRYILDFPRVNNESFQERLADLHAVGAAYDADLKKWSVSTEEGLKRLRRWLTPPPRPRYRTDIGEIGRYLRYCDDVLQQADLDKLVDKNAITTNRSQFTEGHLEKPPSVEFLQNAPSLSQCLLKAAVPLQDSGSAQDDDTQHGNAEHPEVCEGVQERAEGDESEAQSAPMSDLRAIFVAFGFSWKGKDGKSTWKILVAVPAAISSSGEMFPVYGQLPLFNVEFFEPQPKKRQPMLGNVLHLETVLRDTPDFAGTTWPEYVDWVNDIFSKATSGIQNGKCDITEFKDEKKRPFSVTVTPYTRNDSMVAALHDLYVAASGVEQSQIPLLRTLCSGGDNNAPLSNDALRRTAISNTGHMSAQYGLDPSQRLALRHLLETPHGHPLAVSGPPGTGKTSMMQSVIATVVVNSVLASTPQAPLIIASSATNQAVTNIIKAFAGIGLPFGDRKLDARWIPDVPSYGWYFPAPSKADSADAAEFQQLLRDREQNSWRYSGTATAFQQSLDASSDLSGLRGLYLERFRAVFREASVTTAEGAAAYIREKLQHLVASEDAHSLKQSLQKFESLRRLIADAPLHKRRGAKTAFDDYEKRMKRLDRYEAALQARVSATNEAVWDSPTEPPISTAPVAPLLEPKMRPILIGALAISMLTAIVAGFTKNIVVASALAAFWASASVLMFRPTDRRPSRVGEEPAALREARRAAQQRLDRFYRRNSLLSTPPPGRELLAGIDQIDAIASDIESIATEFLPEDAARAWNGGFKCGRMNGAMIDDDEDYKQGYALGQAIARGSKEDALTDMLEAFLDRTIRVRCFHLAARYWEGRWLAESDNPIDGEDEVSIVASLRRHCMLAPVVVATANTLPNLL